MNYEEVGTAGEPSLPEQSVVFVTPPVACSGNIPLCVLSVSFSLGWYSEEGSFSPRHDLCARAPGLRQAVITVPRCREVVVRMVKVAVVVGTYKWMKRTTEAWDVKAYCGLCNH